jgi:excinuclease ABC subunit A
MQDSIFIKGAKTHNLKNIDISIPRSKMVVVTGVSGSGKSSLVFDTLFAEGQRRYVESLSSYARQFLSRMNKPDVEYIKGICPAIAIEQKVSTTSTRSTVGTLTEIYDYVRLLYARIGITHSPISGTIVKKDEITDVVNYIKDLKEEERILIISPMPLLKKADEELDLLQQKGFQRIYIADVVYKIEDVIEDKVLQKKIKKKLDVVIDRLVWANNEENVNRAGDSILTAFNESGGDCIITNMDTHESKIFNNRFEADGMIFQPPSVHLFNFNNSFGACSRCEGFGTVLDLDIDLMIPDKSLSVYEDCIVPWRGELMRTWKQKLIAAAAKFDFPIHRAYEDLTDEEKGILWTGNKHFEGLEAFFKYLVTNQSKIQYRILISRFKGKTKCPDCQGSRIRKDAHYVKVGGKSIGQILDLPIKKLIVHFEEMKLNAYDQKVADRIFLEIKTRLRLLINVGLEYLTLNRYSNTLSGGESQRINLTRSLGSNLTNSLYILDEPSIGLHPRDTERLIGVLQELKKLNNTVVIVEHEEEIMRQADYIIDIGPEAGVHGGTVVFEGDYKTLMKSGKSLTAQYLKDELKIVVPTHVRQPLKFIELKGASHHNLKKVDIKIPLQAFTAVSGVSGSGKTTLIKKILYPALKRAKEMIAEKPGDFREIIFDQKAVYDVELIDQNPLGRTSRSNPVTYVKAFDHIRDLYADLQISHVRGLQAKAFSFNVEGGRCEACKGDGIQIVEMQFLADIELECESCKGQRYKEEVLEIKYRDKNIYEVLNMTVDEALIFFTEKKNICDKIQPLQDVGLGYIKLGQSTSTLSGGEAQRVKLASYLTKGHTSSPIVFIFDEPTTGLHFHDIVKLLKALNELVNIGHTVIVIEHNLDIIKSADWLIDLGPEGGDEGGFLLYQGEPKGILKVKGSYTADYIKGKF